MPKIIDEARNKMIQSARNCILEKGYKAMSLRKVALESGVAVGTIYNYFDSKDDLIAAVMEEDWNVALLKMDDVCQYAKNMNEGILGINQAIDEFCEIYENIWNHDSSTLMSFRVVNERHGRLLKQVSDKIIFLMNRFKFEKDIEIAPLLAHMLLSIVLRDKDYQTQIKLMSERLFQ